MPRPQVQASTAVGPALDRTHLPDGIPVVVACSGGSDSMALLYLAAGKAKEAGWAVTVAHLDHALRDGSAADSVFVQEASGRLGLQCVVTRREVASEARPGEGTEGAARRIRYEFLHRVADRAGPDAVILTAHTADDQAETLALRLRRGTGPRGLRGILARRQDGVVRPILHERREELRAWLRSLNLGWREDPTNRDPSILRSGLRLALETLPPRVYEELVERAGAVVRGASRLYPLLLGMARWWNAARLEEAAGRIGGGIGESGHAALWPGEFVLETPTGGVHLDWLDQTLLDAALEALGADPRAVTRRLRSDLLHGAREADTGEGRGGVTQLGPDLWAEPVGGALLLARGTGPNWEDGRDWTGCLPGPGVGDIGGLSLPRGGMITLRPIGREELRPILSGDGNVVMGSSRTVMPAETAVGLRVRYARRGDSMRPFGMQGRRSLSDLFGEMGVPRLRRGRLAVIEGGGEILWVAGLRSSEACRIGGADDRAVLLELEPEVSETQEAS